MSKENNHQSDQNNSTEMLQNIYIILRITISGLVLVPTLTFSSMPGIFVNVGSCLHF